MNTENDNDNETMSLKELRRQIKGNLEIAANTWPLTQLVILEQCAYSLALSGLYAEGLQYKGLVELDKLIYDETGKIRLASDPDDKDNIFKVLAGFITDNEAKAKECACDTEGSCKAHGEISSKPKDDYSKFF